jgi:hypothetical protein
MTNACVHERRPVDVPSTRLARARVSHFGKMAHLQIDGNSHLPCVRPVRALARCRPGCTITLMSSTGQ